MPPKKPGKPKGGKRGRRGPNEVSKSNRELNRKDDEQEYGQAMKMFGNGRVEVYCFDGKTRMCHIRGKMAKRVWINQGDIVLIGLRDFQDEKADIIGKYSLDEVRQLKKLGDLPEDINTSDRGQSDGDLCWNAENKVRFEQSAPQRSLDDDELEESHSLEMPDIEDI